MPPVLSAERYQPRHYHWAGLDFIFDRDGAPVLIEANRSSHMLGEYLEFHDDDRPFELVAGIMNQAGGIPCLLWRRGDPFPLADEDACFIGQHLAPHLQHEPVICNVEDNQQPRQELTARDGRTIRPGSIFRWWYGLPWSYERGGVTVINPNCLWLVVRDKLQSYQALSMARAFRTPRSFAVASTDDVLRQLSEQRDLFANGYVLKPRVGWGGFGVQVGDPGAEPRPTGPNDMLSERIIPELRHGKFWEVRVFVMAGVYLGGIRHTSRTPLTNYWQGACPEPLDAETAARLELPALEAVRLLDVAAERIHQLPQPPRSELTNVIY